jgi:hypothetical protein
MRLSGPARALHLGFLWRATDGYYGMVVHFCDPHYAISLKVCLKDQCGVIPAIEEAEAGVSKVQSQPRKS